VNPAHLKEFTVEEVAKIIENGKCQATGIKFDRTVVTKKGRRPFAASPDRRDNDKGYTKENTAWVVTIFNYMRNCFSYEDVQYFLDKIEGKNIMKIFNIAAFICTKENPWNPEVPQGEHSHPDAVMVQKHNGWPSRDVGTFICPHCQTKFRKDL